MNRPTSTGALVLLAVPVALTVLRFTRALFLPILAAVLLQFVLEPLIRAARRVRIPPSISAAIILLACSGSAAGAAYLVYQPALDWARELPAKLHRAEYKLGAIKEPVKEVTRATKNVEEIARIPSADDEQVVRVEKASLADGLFAALGDLAAGSLIGLVLTYFLLSHGQTIASKLSRSLPPPSGERSGASGLRSIQARVSRYLLTITAINIGLGAAVGGLLFAVGMPNPALWGVMACVLNFVPYLGSMVGVVVVFLVGLVTFEPLGPTLAAAAGYAALSTIEGLLITPMILGRRLTLSPVAILLWLLLWNWLWGIPGALIAVPLLVALKVFSDSYESLAPLRIWME